MRIDLDGQVAVITGGAQGIGRATALGLASNGAVPVIVDVAADAAVTTAAEVRERGGQCLTFEGDVSDLQRMEAVVAEVLASLGRIDILINNAGVNSLHRVPIHEYTLDDWHRIVQVDMTGLFVTSRAVIPAMLQGSGGRIVNVSSIAGLVPLRLQSAYVAAKAGVANLTRSMAAELGEHGIRVNAVAPGSTLTGPTEKLFYGDDAQSRDRAESLLAHIPLGRPGLPEEIANAILFLVAPESSYVTGAVLPVDGGWITSYHRDW
jgi:3-oxoacyl-[acyl-carrier protein] reductase